jgi:hypothetical protein
MISQCSPLVKPTRAEASPVYGYVVELAQVVELLDHSAGGNKVPSNPSLITAAKILLKVARAIINSRNFFISFSPNYGFVKKGLSL